jgi:hypothetical protein
MSVLQLVLGMDNEGNGVQFLAKERDFFLLHSIQIPSETHPAPYTINTR